MKRSLYVATAIAFGLSTFTIQQLASADVNVQAGPAHVQVDTNRNRANQNQVQTDNDRQQDSDYDYADDATKSDTILRASTVIGCTVYNSNNESLGSIDDVVLDAKTGKINYAAVSMGGFLGMGDDLYAVPWSALKCENRDGEHVCVLNVDKERLSKAEGFDQDNWPNMADRSWKMKNDQVYSGRVGVNN
ncbi:PRC-barrel domain protein [Botrimarina colliarenosi]|uniref:PRC-barrel domain protein n=1 Tax=Botrimarina colliarenosi TaxID=2528001 RepID=A0A5C6AKU4_9BACT|nr:PRC-barrel domain-containing protein [Botrimarina colliarenosi]TWU00643.1 PRC-barrel domain protein [Botrimarina colliarenosi]